MLAGVSAMALLLGLLLMPVALAQDRGRAVRLFRLIVIATLRRVFEYGFALAAFVALSPMFLMISLLVKLTTPGTIFVREHGVSRSGKPVTLYKFRTRTPYGYGYSPRGFYMTSDQNPRFTWFGRILHKSSLHLLPRLLNVLTGDLYLIGVSPLDRDLLVSNFSKDLTRREHDLVGEWYKVSTGETFFKVIDDCMPVGLVTHSDLNAYQLKPWQAKVTKSLDTRPRLKHEVDYFLYATFPSVRLFILLIGKFVIRLLIAINLVKLEEIGPKAPTSD